MYRISLIILFAIVFYLTGQSSDNNTLSGRNLNIYQLTPAFELLSDTRLLKPEFKFSDLADSIEIFIKADAHVKNTPKYAINLQFMIQQSLADLGLIVFGRMAEAYNQKNIKKFEKHAADLVEIGIDMNLLTNDRQWKSHVQRWAKFIRFMKLSLILEKPLTEIIAEQNSLDVDRFVFPVRNEENTIETAIRLFEKYKIHLISNYYAL